MHCLSFLFYINIIPPNFIMELMFAIAQGMAITENYEIKCWELSVQRL